MTLSSRYPFLTNQLFSDGEEGVSALFKHFFYKTIPVSDSGSPQPKAEKSLSPQQKSEEGKEASNCSEDQVPDNSQSPKAE